MKKFLVFFVIMALLLPGCSFFGGGKKQEPVKPKAQQSELKKEQPKADQKDYYIGLETPVSGIKDWVYRYQRYDGVFLQKIGDYRAVLVSMGEKFSPGYGVTINKIDQKADKWVIQVSFKQPKEEDYSGKGVYPHEVASIISDGKPVEVVNVTGPGNETPVKVIEIPEGKKLGVSKNFVIFTPVDGQKITSPVVVKGKARVFEANFRITIEDGHYQLAEKILMADQGAPAWGNFEVSLPFDKPTNPQGFIILSYANMANGKMIEELLLPVKF